MDLRVDVFYRDVNMIHGEEEEEEEEEEEVEREDWETNGRNPPKRERLLCA